MKPTVEDIYNRITPIFRELFDDPSITPNDEMTAEQVPAWDSLSHVSLVVALESEFSIRFSISELQDLKNVGNLVQLIQNKL
jgi:acyl carrier protein